MEQSLKNYDRNDLYFDMIISDGLGGFKKGYKKALYTKSKPRTTHVEDVGIRNRHTANNIYERLNGEIRDIISRMRGFKSEHPALIDLIVIYHNFVRQHAGIGNILLQK